MSVIVHLCFGAHRQRTRCQKRPRENSKDGLDGKVLKQILEAKDFAFEPFGSSASSKALFVLALIRSR